RIREVVEEAICVSGRTFSDSLLTNMIKDMAKIFKFVGPINFQFMKLGDDYKLMEINARSSGGMGITVNSGVNIPELTCRMLNNSLNNTIVTYDGVYPNIPEIIARQRHKSLTL